MDRYDEQKPNRLDDEPVIDTDNSQFGDVLGLGGSPVPKAPDDPSADYDAESVARRRERSLGEAGGETSTSTPERRAGATGIDMGAGGQGTGISEE